MGTTACAWGRQSCLQFFRSGSRMISQGEQDPFFLCGWKGAFVVTSACSTGTSCLIKKVMPSKLLSNKLNFELSAQIKTGETGV